MYSMHCPDFPFCFGEVFYCVTTSTLFSHFLSSVGEHLQFFQFGATIDKPDKYSFDDFIVDLHENL